MQWDAGRQKKERKKKSSVSQEGAFQIHEHVSRYMDPARSLPVQQLAAFLGHWPLRTLEEREPERKTKKEERGGERKCGKKMGEGRAGERKGEKEGRGENGD